MDRSGFPLLPHKPSSGPLTRTFFSLTPASPASPRYSALLRTIAARTASEPRGRGPLARAIGSGVRSAGPSLKRTSEPRVCSVCIGSFLLAAAGILDGRRATTHWKHAQLLAQSHPAVTVVPDAIFVRDGSVWSSAAVTTGIDLALALVEEDAGRDVAMTVAQLLAVYVKRAGPAVPAQRPAGGADGVGI